MRGCRIEDADWIAAMRGSVRCSRGPPDEAGYIAAMVQSFDSALTRAHSSQRIGSMLWRSRRYACQIFELSICLIAPASALCSVVPAWSESDESCYCAGTLGPRAAFGIQESLATIRRCSHPVRPAAEASVRSGCCLSCRSNDRIDRDPFCASSL